jgi:YD repeat-containing protein
VAGQTTSLDENYTECATPTGKTASCPGAKTVEFRDALGRVTKTELSEGATLKTRTTNTYDGLNRVTNTTVTDPGTGKTAPTDFEYDSFSRRIKMTDPGSGPSGARGVWTYAYDNAGNLLYQNDPKSGQHVEFCYDPLNRVKRKLYPSGDAQLVGAPYTTACGSSSPGMPYLKYLYDVQSAYSCDTNGIGRLCAVDENLTASAATLLTIFIYDERGRVRYEYGSRSMLGKSTFFTRTNTYDGADRLTAVTYPTNFSNASETVQYTYDHLGSLGLVASTQQTYASGMTYDVFGRTSLWIDGSGLRHTMAYGSATTNFRLSQLKTADSGGVTHQQFDYPTYDVAGNLRTLTDNTPTSRYGSTSPLRNSWTYLYDGLGRLKSAQLTAGTPTSFTYDGLGNMLTGNQLTFAYTDTVHPHRLDAARSEQEPHLRRRRPGGHGEPGRRSHGALGVRLPGRAGGAGGRSGAARPAAQLLLRQVVRGDGRDADAPHVPRDSAHRRQAGGGAGGADAGRHPTRGAQYPAGAGDAGRAAVESPALSRLRTDGGGGGQARCAHRFHPAGGGVGAGAGAGRAGGGAHEPVAPVTERTRVGGGAGVWCEPDAADLCASGQGGRHSGLRAAHGDLPGVRHPR